MQLIELLYPALILIVLLVFVHAIFGLEIIRRGVIFTDLAIGQMAAVGLAVSIGFLDGAYQTPLTLFFATFGALMITYASRRLEHIEAFIGMLYALGASSIMILLANSPQGAELFSKLSAVDILFTSIEDIYPAALLYLSVALIMFFYYPRTSGLVKELVFFVMLALTVTSSVQLAGVLVVFALLVAPALIGLAQMRYKPLYIAWAVGLLLCILALTASYHFDLPTGYAIVFFQSFGALFYLLAKPRKGH